MTNIRLQISENKTNAFLEMVKQLGYARKVQVEEPEPTKAEILEGIREAVEEVKQIRAGKLKGIPARDLLNEL